MIITKELIERSIKMLSKDNYTKKDVLNELKNIANHVHETPLLGQDTSKKLIEYLVAILESEGYCLTYNVKKQEGNPQTAIIRIRKNSSKTYDICKLLQILKGKQCKPSRQRVLDKYSTFKSKHDMDNLTEWEQGYLTCLQQLMVPLKAIEGHDVYKPKEVEKIDEVSVG